MKCNKLILTLSLTLGFSAFAFNNSFAQEVNITSLDELSLSEITSLLDTNSKEVEKIEQEQEKQKETAQNTVSNNDLSNKIIATAKSKLGAPYSYGSRGPYAFDCSGFVSYVMAQHGINLPRTASSQATVGKRVSKSDLQAGDLVFFNTYGGISHVGIYISDGNFIHASSYGSHVKISNLSEAYYIPRYVTATRVL